MAQALNGNPSTAVEESSSRIFRLLPALRRLDQLLEEAIHAAQVAYGAETAGDRFRGLYISAQDAEQLLRREPATPLLRKEMEGIDGIVDARVDYAPQWSRLQSVYALSTFDLDLLMIGLAPELDLRYERLYAYLQDDVTRRRPGVDLALNLLCPTAEEKLLRRSHFLTDGSLVHNKLIHLIADPNHFQPPLLSQYFKVDDQVISLLLDETALDSRLVNSCQLVQPSAVLDQSIIAIRTKRKIQALVRRSRSACQSLVLYFAGPEDQEKIETAKALACDVSAPILVADLLRAPDNRCYFEDYLRVLVRETWRQDALLYMHGSDGLSLERRLCIQQSLPSLVEQHASIAILCSKSVSSAVSTALGSAITVVFSMPDFTHRRSCWQACLLSKNLRLKEEELDDLAARFRLTSEQIVFAVDYACNQAALRAGDSDLSMELTLQELFAAVRSQSGLELGALAQKVEPRYGWDDIVLPEDSVKQLKEICCCVTQGQRVFEDWGFGQKLSQGKGTHALFSGPSGTGKTMAAEVVAKELGFDLYRIDLSGVVSKYIGETEKNLDRIFTVAENTSAVLFFDEADALFGKRSEVRDSHDRYANLEISYLLQKMEQYEGIAILATNLRANLDNAFLRRLNFVVHFPFPDETQRLRIWQQIWPEQTPLADDADLPFLAKEYKFTGGNIKNVALAATFLAAGDSGSVGMNHLLQATRREYQKVGKSLPEVGELQLAVRSTR